MFERNILNNLTEWKGRASRKPLILRGARQVGKTTAVNMFSKEFDLFIELNLDLFSDIQIFKEEYGIEEIIQAIQVMKNISFKKRNILIFIDEIQNSPHAVKMLRYFYEKRPDIFVIAAGSLLELALENKDISFPVGRVEYLYMYPFNFNEFLKAIKENILTDIIDSERIPDYAHDKLMKLFHRYTLIGGMPEAIKTYLDNNDINSLKTIYQALLVSFVNDSEKYAKNNTLRTVIAHCLNTIPSETGKRIKFQNFGNSSYRSREVGEAIRLIEKAMIIYLIYPVTNTDIPSRTDFKKSPKLQLLDTGLINFFTGIQPEFFKFDNLNSIYKGFIAEHIVRQEIIASDYTHNNPVPIWTRESKASNAEVDILIQVKGTVIPVEVKSGASGSLKSLHLFMDESNSEFAVRLCRNMMNFERVTTPSGKTFTLINLPYYLAGSLEKIVGKFI
ncbi:MAG TPA: AAA family ATPase [Clostridiales bacterium]|nr:AAA family ATPase [Clostridiales bacterium]